MFRHASTAALVADLEGRAEAAMVAFLNEIAQQIYEQSQVEVPKSGDHQSRDEADYPEKSLAECGEVLEAEPGNLSASVVYDSPYAAAQHEGHMIEHRKSGKEVQWEAMQYTTPGTKKKYLEDPGKAAVAQGPEQLAVHGRMAFGGLA